MIGTCAKGLIATVGVAVALAFTPVAAQAKACGRVTYDYRVSGAPYRAVLAGTDYHSGIDASGIGCSSARDMVLRYATTALRHARSRLDFRAPRHYHGFRCHRIRDGDDSGRNFCRRGSAHVFFSDSDGQFLAP